MRRKENPDPNAHTSPTEYQTPARTPTTAPSSSRPSNSKSTTTARRSAQTPIAPPHSRSNSSRNYNTFSSSLGRQQSTLTQIDWVATRQHPDSEDDDLDDDRLDYIAAEPNAQYDDTPHTNTNTNTNTRDVIEISDDSGNDADYQPAPSSRTRPARGVRFGQDTTTKTDISRRRRSTPKPNSAENGTCRRKSGGSVRGSIKKDKQPKERDKTLTQMDYVRRYLKIEPDDDVKLEYTYYSPKKDRDPESREAHRRSAAEALESTKEEQKDGVKRRRLTEELDSKDDSNPEGIRPGEQLSRGLVTPKKTIKSEIPSSQSPESPGFVLVSPSHFCGINSFPLKQASPVDRPVKEEQPGSAGESVLHNLDRASPSPNQTSLPNSPALPSTSRSVIPSDDADDSDTTPTKCPTNTQRTIVYETDAESDYGETQDDLSVPPSSQKPKLVSGDDNPIEDIQDSQRYDSQELPSPVIPSGLDNETGPSYPDLSSDASICYRRPHHSTQYPLEPIPPMNTQALAELFPQEKENSAQQIMTDTTQTQSSPAVQRHPLRIHHQLTQAQTQTQTQTQSQSNSQDLKTSTEIVPESSPGTRQDSNPSMPQESVVQVESSQPADRFLRNSRNEQDSGPRGFVGNQLLSSSVLESIPMPPLWMGSQDSVGEPYSEPGNE